MVEITKKLSDILDRCATTTQPSTVLLYTIIVDCFFFTLASIRATATVCRSLFIWIYKFTNTYQYHLHAHTIITTPNCWQSIAMVYDRYRSHQPLRWIVELCMTLCCELKARDISRRNASVNKLSEWFALDTCITLGLNVNCFYVACRSFFILFFFFFKHFFFSYVCFSFFPLWFSCVNVERWLLYLVQQIIDQLYFPVLIVSLEIWKLYNGLTWFLVFDFRRT